MSFRRRGSRGRPVVKITDSWSACCEFEPSTAEDTPLQRRPVHTLNMMKLKRLAFGVVGKLGEGYTRSDFVLVT
ncbi:hypothetical protein TNCV_772961 [Trichonephila clavipes]|nr:hypothetical protein TNCV_772961 [Trichonephila clavipes]